MPTYQYRCTECGEDLEAVQKFSDAALTECPRCGGPLRKLFNAVGVVFKGSGFYGSKPEKKTADAGKEVAAKANENGSATSDKATASSPATAASTAGSSSEGRSQKVGATAQ